MTLNERDVSNTIAFCSYRWSSKRGGTFAPFMNEFPWPVWWKWMEMEAHCCFISHCSSWKLPTEGNNHGSIEHVDHKIKTKKAFTLGMVSVPIQCVCFKNLFTFKEKQKSSVWYAHAETIFFFFFELEPRAVRGTWVEDNYLRLQRWEGCEGVCLKGNMIFLFGSERERYRAWLET